MNIRKHEKMYSIIRERVLSNFMKQLTEMKPVKKQQKKPRRHLFQMYDYTLDSDNDDEKQLQIDYSHVEEEIKREIDNQFNDYLCQFESSQLAMEIFLLQKEQAIELDEIDVLKNKIKRFQANSQPAKNQQKFNSPLKINTAVKEQILNNTVSFKQSKRQNYKMCLVPNIRVEVLPQNKDQSKVDERTLKYEELAQLLRRQIQLRTKQTNSDAVKTIKIDQLPRQKVSQQNKLKMLNDLMLTQKSILQNERLWLKSKGDQRKSKQNKKRIQKKLAQFWQKANNYQRNC